MADTRYQGVLLFGAPGVGKGTQGRILGQIPGFFHLSCGEVFRSLDISSPDGEMVYKYSSQGKLVPDDITIRIWNQHLEGLRQMGNFKPREDLLVLDGIPRNVRQAEILSEHVVVKKVIHLVCPDKEAMIHRIRRRAIRENRADDAQEDVIRRRFDVYEHETRPVLEFYAHELHADVNCIGAPAEVLLKVLEVFVPVQNALFRDKKISH